MKPMKKKGTLNGRTVEYTNQSIFIVETSRDGVAFKEKHRLTGNLDAAVTYYNGLNVTEGVTKRLRIDGKAATLAENTGTANRKAA